MENALILLVEDDESHAELLEVSLQKTSRYSLRIARGLEEARAFLATNQPDIVFSDLVLKDGVGSELLPLGGESRGNDPGCPIVLMTSYGSEATAVDVMKQGAFDYLIKSEQMFHDFPRIVERALREWRQVQMRREAEKALLRSEEHLRMALEAASVGTWEWDLATDRITHHIGAADSLGVAASTRTGSWSAYLQLVKEEDRGEIEAVMREALAESGPGRGDPYVVEHRVRRRDGQTQWVQLQGRVIRDDKNTPIRVAGTVVDISARKNAESKLRNMEHQLAHMTRVATMGEMLSGIAHELNHPLYTIKNYGKACSNLIENHERLDVDQLQQWLDEICNMAEHAGEMIRRMRNYVKKDVSQREDIDIGQIVEMAMSLVRFEAAKRGVSITTQMPSQPPSVCVDVVQIEQVLVNLIRNAFESMQAADTENPHVHIAVVEHLDQIEVRVNDNGPGLEDGQNNIFEAFATTKPNGLGLGLAIARNLVESHEGQLQADRSPAGGASFSFTLPASAMRATSP